MLTPRQLASEVQLLVEGNDQRNFFEAFVKHRSLADLQVQNFGGVTDLHAFLPALMKMPDFRKIVRMIGIVRDAETSAAAAFQSVQSSLRNAGLAVPDRPAEQAGLPPPAVSVLVLPGGTAPGMLETLLCRTFADSRIDECIDSYFACVKAACARIDHPDKARTHAYLATRQKPHVSVGVAAQKGYWDLDHPAFDGVRRFLESLMICPQA